MFLQAIIRILCGLIPGGFGQPCRSRIITTTAIRIASEHRKWQEQKEKDGGKMLRGNLI
jgi:hypothetical protein